MCISSFRSLFFPFPVLFPSPSFHRFFLSLSIHMPLSTPSSFTLSLSFRLVHFNPTPSFIITGHLCLTLHILPSLSPSLSLFSKRKQQTQMESRFTRGNMIRSTSVALDGWSIFPFCSLPHFFPYSFHKHSKRRMDSSVT